MAKLVLRPRKNVTRYFCAVGFAPTLITKETKLESVGGLFVDVKADNTVETVWIDENGSSLTGEEVYVNYPQVIKEGSGGSWWLDTMIWDAAEVVTDEAGSSFAVVDAPACGEPNATEESADTMHPDGDECDREGRVCDECAEAFYGDGTASESSSAQPAKSKRAKASPPTKNAAMTMGFKPNPLIDAMLRHAQDRDWPKSVEGSYDFFMAKMHAESSA